MKIVLLAAVGVGGSTMAGSLLGYLFRRITQRFEKIVMSFASGVMLAAAVLGLILPSLEYGGKYAVLVTITGILIGAIGLGAVNRLVPYLYRLIGTEENTYNNCIKAQKVLLFVAAIAIHNLPEGLAAGVGCGTGNMADALLIAGSIALQNIPEGMVIIGPMMAVGIPPRRTMMVAMMTGVVEIVGVLAGYCAVYTVQAILPFALAFAGGTMLFVIADEMIPDIHAEGGCRGGSLMILLGFCLMLMSDVLLG